MAICSMCTTKVANPENEGSFGRPVCDDCFAEANVDMDDELNDLDDLDQ